MSDVTVRGYEPRDLDAILLAWEEATRLAHPFMTETFLDQERQNIPNVYIPNTDTWVAELDGEVVAFISLMGNEIGAIFARPGVHGRGIGRALLDQAQAIHEVLEVEVFEANTIGRRFYDRQGFAPLSAYVHEETGERLLRLRLEPSRV